MIAFDSIQKKYQTESPTEETYVLLKTISRLQHQLTELRKAHMQLVAEHNKRHHSPYDETVFLPEDGLYG